MNGYGIEDNIKRIRERIGEAAVQSGRAPEDIKLIAAAKMNDVQAVRCAIKAGVDAIGENRVQELLAKNEQGAYRGAPLHFIGHLQSNKVRQVVGVCDIIESVDSQALLTAISRRAVSLGITQEVLLEVNIGGEETKSGFRPELAESALDFAAGLDGIKVLGLMAIPPNVGKNGALRYYFDRMCKLFVDMSAKKYDNVSMRILSMGMSDSFEEAIRAGANAVRIGTAIFGSRANTGADA